MSEKNVVELDDRPIAGIWWTEGADGYSVGMPGITKITVCHVNGEMAHVPWFEVWKGNALFRRVRAGDVTEVCYEPPA